MESNMDSRPGSGTKASPAFTGGDLRVEADSQTSLDIKSPPDRGLHFNEENSHRDEAISSQPSPAKNGASTKHFTLTHGPNGQSAGPAGNAFRVNNFDLLRILAATQVLVIHSMARLGIPVPGGLKWLEWFPGVPIFFVISGYLVSASFERQENILRYLKNRFLRIYPGLWACIGLTVVVTTALGYRRTHLMDFAWLPAQLLGIIYTPQFLKHFGAGTYNGSLWTIPIELQFYLALPLVYMATRRLRMGKLGVPFLLAVFIGITLIINYTLPGFGTERETTLDKLVRYSFVNSFYMFLLGVALQRFQAFRSKLIAGKGFYWIAAYLLLRVVLPDLSPLTTVLSYLFLGISAVAVAYTLPKASERILHGQDISYGVYIYHGLVINLLIELKMKRSLYEVGVVLIAALAVGAMSWKFVEEPFLRKKKRRLTATSEQTQTSACEAGSVLGPGL
jgi:peptidoglycan/LPS O-acetylase OafA/YrhL